MRTVYHPDGGATIFFDEGPVPYQDEPGRVRYISVSDARELLETGEALQAAAKTHPDLQDPGFLQRLDAFVERLRTAIDEQVPRAHHLSR